MLLIASSQVRAIAASREVPRKHKRPLLMRQITFPDGQRMPWLTYRAMMLGAISPQSAVAIATASVAATCLNTFSSVQESRLFLC